MCKDANRKSQREAIEEMRAANRRLREIAEFMTSNAVMLREMQESESVEKAKKRVNKIEKGTRRAKNGPKR